MSTAPAAEAPTNAAPAKGKKKLIIIIAAVAVVLLGGGGGAFFMMKKNAAAAEAAAAEADGEGESTPAAHGKAAAKSGNAKTVPTFVPMDPFTVNLADRDSERYAQIGITLEIEDPQTADQLKAYMPAVRNNILMAIADRTAADLLGREGKARLADKIIRETSRALGVEVPDEEVVDEEAAAEDKAVAKKKKKKVVAELPIRAVHFSNFIIQ